MINVIPKPVAAEQQPAPGKCCEGCQGVYVTAKSLGSNKNVFATLGSNVSNGTRKIIDSKSTFGIC